MQKITLGMGIVIVATCAFSMSASALGGGCANHNHDCFHDIVSVMRVHHNSWLRWHDCENCEYNQRYLSNSSDDTLDQEQTNNGVDYYGYHHGRHYGRSSGQGAHTGSHHNARHH